MNTSKKVINSKLPNDIYFAFDDDTYYVLSDYKKLDQVENLEFSELSSEDNKILSDYVQNYLIKLKSRTDFITKLSKSKYVKIVSNELDDAIYSMNNPRLHIPKFNNIYHDIL